MWRCASRTLAAFLSKGPRALPSTGASRRGSEHSPWLASLADQTYPRSDRCFSAEDPKPVKVSVEGFGVRTKSISLADSKQNMLNFMPSSYGRACSSKAFQVDVDYLKVEGYGNSSHQEIRERQRDLGLLSSLNNEDGSSTPYLEEEFGAFQIDMDYLKAKGFGSSSYEEIRERQRRLGLLDNPSTPYLEEEFGAFQIDTHYLKAKGFGSSSYEEIRERQRRLGLLDNPRKDGGDHLEQLISGEQ